MAKYIFTQSANALVVKVDTESGSYLTDNQSYTGVSAILANDVIQLREYGIDKQNFRFHEILEIDGVAPTDIEDAYQKLSDLIANFNWGGTAPYIPTSGTEEGEPVTGEIKFIGQDGSEGSINNFDGFSLIGKFNEINGQSSLLLGANYSSLSANDFDDSTGGTILVQKITDTYALLINMPSESRGITGSFDYTANAQELDFIQKKYVDEKILYGSEEFTLNGIQTVFNIPHGMSTIPTSFSVTFEDASNLNFVQSIRTIDATNIVFTCNDAPLVGTQKVFWQVFK